MLKYCQRFVDNDFFKLCRGDSVWKLANLPQMSAEDILRKPGLQKMPAAINSLLLVPETLVTLTFRSQVPVRPRNGRQVRLPDGDHRAGHRLPVCARPGHSYGRYGGHRGRRPKRDPDQGRRAAGDVAQGEQTSVSREERGDVFVRSEYHVCEAVIKIYSAPHNCQKLFAQRFSNICGSMTPSAC